jgi:hypothetical protein
MARRALLGTIAFLASASNPYGLVNKDSPCPQFNQKFLKTWSVPDIRSKIPQKRGLSPIFASGLKDDPQASAGELKASMCQVYPKLAEVAISNVWSGLVAYTFDHAPHLGQYSGGTMEGYFMLRDTVAPVQHGPVISAQIRL